MAISLGAELSTATRQFQATAARSVGEEITPAHELLGVTKGSRQVLTERGRPFVQGVAYKKKKYRKNKTTLRKTALKAWLNNDALLLAYLEHPSADETPKTDPAGNTTSDIVEVESNELEFKTDQKIESLG